ncbi:hypothetical protein NPIL_337231 [Nephila pilipes]|uniref:Uncharacterized protein n=1 Tax=Nephila pilipes TaxID=299642 RepID=A0A8X6T2P5_NEPPI|nr:hypothetical protein NPIL_337231 [Nephila pilipes]
MATDYKTKWLSFRIRNTPSKRILTERKSHFPKERALQASVIHDMEEASTYCTMYRKHTLSSSRSQLAKHDKEEEGHHKVNENDTKSESESHPVSAKYSVDKRASFCDVDESNTAS